MNKNYISPKKASKILGVHWMTLRNWSEKGQIDTIRSPGGKRFYNVNKYMKDNSKIPQEEQIRHNICYCRVSSSGQKGDLENQINYMKEKYPDYEILSDIGSGINFKRANLKRIINYAIKNELGTLVVSYKDRLCRIAFELIEEILKEYSKTEIIVINSEEKSSEEELVDDMLEIITVFSSRLYGMRSYKKEIKTI